MEPRRVLLIDDDLRLSHLIRLELAELRNVTFAHASTGEQGVKIAEADPPDVILLDFALPGMDGLDTLRQLRARERTARTPIVAMTGTNRNLPRCAAMIAECDAFLPKPFRVHTLRRAACDALEGKSAAVK